MTLYLAYASNLCPLQMQKRCPSSQYLGNTELRGWELFFFDDGYASIRESDVNTAVFCAIYKLSEQCERALDFHERIDEGYYYRHMLQFDDQEHLVYIASTAETGIPYRDYKHRIISGLEARSAPSTYIELLTSTPHRDMDSPRNDYSDEGCGFSRETT